MQLPRGANALLVLLLILLAAVFGVLATLQYRWIDRVSVAERQQMRANIEFASRLFADDLRRELEPVVLAFERGEDVFDASPELVQQVYSITPDLDARTWQLTDTLGNIPWPRELERVHEQLKALVLDIRFGPPRFPGPFFPEVPAILLVERGGGFRGPPAFPNIALIQLDREMLQKRVLPQLARRHFGSDHDVAIVSGNTILYRSNAQWPDGTTPPDTELVLQPIGAARRMLPPRAIEREQQRAPDPLQWRLIVRRHDGGVDAAVASARSRNLAVSSGIVLILGIAVLLLVALLRRAERLRKQQLEFVAAITHELNTPVAALRSAGENLRDRIIADPDKVSRYGASIVRESTRLGELVREVLELAGMQARRARPHVAVDVTQVIEEAISQNRSLLDSSSIEVETKIDDDLPSIRGDRVELTRAVQNLVANAIRHGGSGEWIGVKATRDGEHVRITVEDRGPGVDASEASQLFEPFYRGRKSASIPGAGLGLAIVRQVARAHGGTVHVEKRRSGAAFTIQVPHD